MEDVHGREDSVEEVLVGLEPVRLHFLLVVADEAAVGAGQGLEPLEHQLGAELDGVGEPHLIEAGVSVGEVFQQLRPVTKVFLAPVAKFTSQKL